MHTVNTCYINHHHPTTASGSIPHPNNHHQLTVVDVKVYAVVDKVCTVCQTSCWDIKGGSWVSVCEQI